MAKDIIYGEDAQAKILSGVSKLATTVAITMGPYGKNVLVGKSVGAPVVTKDGVSVAREVVLADYFEEQGCQLVKEVAGRTADVAGDGTTTATVLADEILSQGSKLVSDGYSPIDFKNGIEKTLDLLIEAIDEHKVDIATVEQIAHVATISTNNDEELGGKIAEAFDAADWHGSVIAEPAVGSSETVVRAIDGVELSSGYIHSVFLEGESSDAQCVFDDCYILIVDRELTHAQDSQQFFAEFAELNKPVLILAKDVKQQALQFFAHNKKAGLLRCVPVKLPNWGKTHDEWMKDLSMLVGAEIMDGDLGKPLSEITKDDLGWAERVVVNKSTTKIVGGKTQDDAINGRLEQYEKLVLSHMGDFARQDVRNRISFLNSKSAVISVGYSTELELREKGDRVEDAIFATKAAVSGGIVPGGGMALLNAAHQVSTSIDDIPEKYQEAARVLLKACVRPFLQILMNAEKDPAGILEEVSKHENRNFGYNVATGEYGDLIELGVVDPAIVTKTALSNAVSIASLLIRTGAAIADVPDNPSGWQPPAGWRVPDQTKNMNHKH